MWSLLSRKTQASVIVGLTIVAVWVIEGLFRLLHGIAPEPYHFVSFAIFVVSSGAALFAMVVWRWVWKRFPILGRRLFPDLTGTWTGQVVSTLINPASQGQPPANPVTVWIRQGMFSTSIKLRSDESTSFSKRCLLEAFPDAGRFRFWYSYENQPKAEFQSRRTRHEGVGWLEVDIDTDSERLLGGYYTDRKTSGDIEVYRISTKLTEPKGVGKSGTKSG